MPNEILSALQARRLKRIVHYFGSVSVPLAFAITLSWFAPLGTAFEFGGDEGYELMKGLLCSRGYALYEEIWNDQPPFHTALLNGLFIVFGPSVLVARLLTVAFAALLVWCLYELVRRHSGHLAAILAIILLIASPHFLQLSVSVMIELPAMALALAATFALFRGFETSKLRWLVSSGVLMGCALQTKLTTAVFLPALGAAWFVFKSKPTRLTAPSATLYPDPIRGKRNERFNTTDGRQHDETRRISGRSTLQLLRVSEISWIVPVIVVFWIISLFFPGENSDSLLKAHFSSQTKAVLAAENGYRFTPTLLWRDYECVIGTVAGVLLILWRRCWQSLFPIFLLTTVVVVHQFHRPFWWYYSLHFAIPMAWLSAIAFSELLKLLLGCEWHEVKKRPLKPAVLLLVWSSMTSLFIGGAIDKLRIGCQAISNRETARDNPIVQSMIEYRDRTRWVFTDRVIYAFHAGLPLPPELAVIPLKRMWSGQISPAFVLERVKQYQPEQVLLLGWMTQSEEISEWLESSFMSVPGSTGPLLLAKRIVRSPDAPTQQDAALIRN